MSVDNVVKASFVFGRSTKTRGLHQWDYGQILQFEGLDLPSAYTVHFANQSMSGDAKTQVGGPDGVDIPDEYLTTGLPVYAWVYLHTGADDGETVYSVTIPVTKRPKPIEDEPTPVQQGAIDTAIAALNEGVETVQGIAEAIPQTIDAALEEAKESGEFDGVGIPAGGTTGQVLSKVSGTDYDTEWTTPSGGGGTSDYTDLSNKPQINSVTLSGNKSLSDIGAASAADVAAKYTKAASGIPASDLSSAVQTSLGKADTALQSAPVSSVNGQTGAVVLDAQDVGALPDSTSIPTKVSDLQNDSGFITGYTETDPTVPSWAKASSKPTYTATEVGALPANTPIPTKVSDLTDDSGHYTKPLNGIPKTDLASDVQTSLGKADTALQSAPVTSVNGQTGAVVLDAQDVGAYEKPVTGIPASDLASGVIPEVHNIPAGGTTGQVLSKASGTDYDTEWTTPGESPVQDVQLRYSGTNYSRLIDGVAIINVGNGLRIGNNSDCAIMVNQPSAGNIRTESSAYVLTPATQSLAVFYGLAKAAGDSTQGNVVGNVGTYTDSAKSAISQMLNSPVTVSGSTPTITALPGVRYVCGECATLDITLPESGCVDITFESGSTPTVLTITPPTGVTLKWANGFDPTALEANTTYEIRFRDGHLASAFAWA